MMVKAVDYLEEDPVLTAVKAPRSADLQGCLRRILAEAPKATGSLRVAVDVEPQSFL